MRQIVFGIALVLATTGLAAQTTKSTAPKPPAPAKRGAPPSATPAAATTYVPAIMQQRMTTLTGCLQHAQDYTLTNAALSQPADAAAGGAAASNASGAAPRAAGRGARPAAPAASEPSSTQPPAPAVAIPPTLKLEGISPARLSILEGKRVQVTGAFQGDTKAAAKAIPRFEAIAVAEATGNCS